MGIRYDKIMNDKLRRRYCIVENTVRDKKNFVVQYKHYVLGFFPIWVDILMHDTLEESIKSIDLLISLKVSE